MINPQAPDKRGEETSVPVAHRDEQGDALEVQLVFAVGEEGALQILGAQCRHLPWLDHYAGFPPSLRESLDSALTRGIARLKDESSTAPVGEALAVLSDALTNFFKAHEQIDAVIHPRVFVEEHTQGAGSKLLATFATTTRNTLLQKEGGWIENWRPFDKQVELNARKLNQDDTELRDKILTIQLGETPRVELISKCAFLLTGVRLKANGETIAMNDDSCIINEKSNALVLPQIPVRNFDAINRADGKAELVLILGAQRQHELPLPVQLKLPTLSEAPVALFIDMGSKFTKRAEVALRGLRGEENSEANLRSALRDQIDAAAHYDGKPVWAKIFEPEETLKYLESRSMPPFNKAELAKGSNEALAAWLADTIRIHAQRAATLGIALSHVFWSFPNTCKRDFDLLNEELKRLAGACVLDRIEVLPEHECLRYRFGDVLSRLAQIAVARKDEHDDAECAKKEYDESWWIEKWWRRKPGPVPDLEAWIERFRRLNADSQLREVIIIDAGGFSLDVHVEVLCKGESCTFFDSFEAGGQQLTEKYRPLMAKYYGCAEEEIPISEAEKEKCSLCSDTVGGSHLALTGLTSEVYREKLSVVITWIRDNTKSKALPVILTGGGMENRFLRELVREMLSQAGLGSEFITSAELRKLIMDNLPDHERNPLRLFARVTSGFSERDIAESRLSNDILGGLIQAAELQMTKATP